MQPVSAEDALKQSLSDVVVNDLVVVNRDEELVLQRRGTRKLHVRKIIYSLVTFCEATSM